MYDLELEKVIKEIKKNKARKVVIQLPDGLKPKATEIKEKLEKKSNAEVFIWLGSNFGSCDIPKNFPKDFDLTVSFGHSVSV